MKKVYAVSSGSYSDYGVVAIFTTRKKAEEFMMAVPSNYYNDIEEYDLDCNVADMVRRGYGVWRVLMRKDGMVERVEKSEVSTYDMNTRHEIWRRSTAPFYKDKGVEDVLDSTVWAKSEKHAVKIANERRVVMIASGEWERGE